MWWMLLLKRSTLGCKQWFCSSIRMPFLVVLRKYVILLQDMKLISLKNRAVFPVKFASLVPKKLVQKVRFSFDVVYHFIFVTKLSCNLAFRDHIARYSTLASNFICIYATRIQVKNNICAVYEGTSTTRCGGFSSLYVKFGLSLCRHERLLALDALQLICSRKTAQFNLVSICWAEFKFDGLGGCKSDRCRGRLLSPATIE